MAAAVTTWCFARCGYYSPGLYDRLAEAALPHLACIPPYNLAQLLWAFSAQGHRNIKCVKCGPSRVMSISHFLISWILFLISTVHIHTFISTVHIHTFVSTVHIHTFVSTVRNINMCMPHTILSRSPFHPPAGSWMQ